MGVAGSLCGAYEESDRGGAGIDGAVERRVNLAITEIEAELSDQKQPAIGAIGLRLDLAYFFLTESAERSAPWVAMVAPPL
jgi:hypothetical protein